MLPRRSATDLRSEQHPSCPSISHENCLRFDDKSLIPSGSEMARIRENHLIQNENLESFNQKVPGSSPGGRTNCVDGIGSRGAAFRPHARCFVASRRASFGRQEPFAAT